ncbi:MAG: PhnA protein [bacterium]|nr:PhnA protein [bacterium]
MSVEKELHTRSESKCELCSSAENLTPYKVPPHSENHAENCALLCKICCEQIENPEKMDPSHWQCLKESMWSQVPAVQVLIWRLLNQLSGEGWSQNLLDMLYLEEETLTWAQSTKDSAASDSDEVKHLDSNGVVLESGDTVTIIKDLNVKGTTFVAKRGTAVRGISLVANNPEHIEGRVNGQKIVILTKFVSKS